MKPVTNSSAQIIVKHFQLLNNHNLKELADQYSPKAKINSPGLEGIQPGVYQLLRQYELYFDYCSDVRFEVKRIIGSGAVFAVEYEVTGMPKSIRSPLRTNFYPNGIQLQNCTIFQIVNNKIIAESTYVNKIVHD